MIVATGGHVDHGKTALVRALTGVDTDRLPEEKRRGISIDLGFAYLQAPGGPSIAFVDVPGHERFVRNMIAGIAAIDVGLLAVAADDGVMPQTREHVDIFDLLAVRHGIVAITKTDRVDSDRVDEVERQVAALIDGRDWRPAAIIATSAPGRIGLDLLHRTLLDLRQSVDSHADLVEHAFRFIVDRSFVSPGSGTVVTGTVVSGTLEPGATVIVSPAGIRVRVRRIQQNHGAIHVARAGERCAMNLVGIERCKVGRGDYLLAEHLHAPTTRLDVELRLVGDATATLAHRTPVHLHAGACDRLARVLTAPRTCIKAGERSFAQLVLEKPIPAFSGDRFVLRDQSARATIAGGTVIDPFAQRRRRQIDPAPRLSALCAGAPEAALDALVRCSPEGVDVAAFARRFALADAPLQRLLQRPTIALLRDSRLRAFDADSIFALTTRIVETLGDYHRRLPSESGMTLPQLRERVDRAFPPAPFETLVRKLMERGIVDITRDHVALPMHRPNRRDDTLQFLTAVERELRAARYAGLRAAQLAALAGVNAEAASLHLEQLLATGGLERFRDDRYLLSSTVDDAANAARAVAQANGGRFTAAQFRDHAGIGRNLAIELLEFLDRRGFTSRVGDVRYLRKGARTVGDEAPSIAAESRLEGASESAARRA
jgi:selenocysteine-specific elongation factor